MSIILAIDGGATKTICLAINLQGMVLAKGEGGPANHLLYRREIVQDSLHQAIKQVLRKKNVIRKDISYVCAGTAGVGVNGEGSEIINNSIRKILARQKVGLAGIKVHHSDSPGVSSGGRICTTGDMVIALEGALRGNPGIIVIAGTGSIIFGRNQQGDKVRVGGWGPIYGNEGSADWIARAGLQAAAMAYDGEESQPC
ncbi:MAG: BadF/BadG/BcrA/BcrD ATPase family protein [Planctomycetota bacterium]